MKVGILTYHATTNYGACLQCFALAKAINGLGIYCENINYECENIVKREFETPIFSQGLIRAPINAIKNSLKRKKKRIIERFICDNSCLSNKKYTKQNIHEANNVYDCFVSGSDIVWEMDVNGGDYTYLLDFVEDDFKKNSYSSSFGYSTVPEKYIKKTADLLKKYKNISVRETEGADIVQQLIGKHVGVTLDPTLLLDKEEWRKKETPFPFKKKYILLYFNDEKNVCLDFAKKQALKYNADILFLTDGIKKIQGVKNIRNVSVEQFLWLIDNAVCVVTSSYHGVAFSINFNTEFYYYNRIHKSRINTIIFGLNIMGRDLESDPIDCKIEWGQINDRLFDLRKNSLRYLNNIFYEE